MNRRLKIILGLIFFTYFVVYLFSLMFMNKPHARMHEAIIVKIASPMQHLVNFTYDKASDVFSHYVFLIHAAKENEQLQTQNGELRQKVVLIDELTQENERLRTLLKLEIPSKYTPIYGERIAFGTNDFERTIKINKGKNENVEVRMPVISPLGVVGQVSKVFGDYSEVLLLTNKDSVIDVIVQRTRARGMLRGFTQHQLAFEFFSIDEDLQVGDIVISSGLDGIYPEGLPVGVISASGKQGRKLFLTASVDPYVDFSKIEEVKVLAPKEKRDF